MSTISKFWKELKADPLDLWMVRSKGSIRLRLTDLRPQKVAAVMVGAYTNEVSMQQLAEDVEYAYAELNKK